MIALLGQPWWYWAAFWLAALLVVAVPLAAYLERRADAQDRAAWDALYGPRSGVYDQALEDLWWEGEA